MRHYFHLLFILFALLLQSCAFDTVEESPYDIYRVEVGTYLNIRATPSKRGKVLGTIDNGTLIDVVEINDGWAKISYRGEEIGYVASDYLVLVKAAKKSAPADDEEPSSSYADDGSSLVADDNSSLKQENPTPPEESKNTKNVFFMGDSTILAPYEKEILEDRLKVAEDYVFIVNTVENVPVKQLFDYAPDVLKAVSKDLDSSMSWWQRVKSWFGGDSPSSHIVLLSYVKNSNLLQAECNGNSLKYLRMSRPEEYFDLQYGIRKGVVEALTDMGLAIDKAGKEYSQRSWFVRGQINTGNIFNYVCDDVIVENILPRDSFWHKWVFGWIFAWPLKTANWIFVLTDSYLATLIIFMFIILGVHFLLTHCTFLLNRKYTQEQLKAGQAGCLISLVPLLSILLNIYLWLCMLSLIVYMVPDMCNIVVMAKSGYSEAVISSAVHSFMTHSVTKNWLLVTMFFVGIFISVGINEEFALLGTLPSDRQRMIFRHNEEALENRFLYSGEKFEKENLEKSSTPYLDLMFNSEELGKILGPAIPLSFVFSGTLLLYASIFLWTKSLKKVIHFATGVISYRKRGLYGY